MNNATESRRKSSPRDTRYSSLRLDEATVQAVVVLRRAIRDLHDVERTDTRAMSPVALRQHRDRVDAARIRRRDARTMLEDLLGDGV